ncbi:MAG: copper amine oxidase N-terminal domain-containing protein [Oscillospiraceae bacterium]|nr:copper amine oxidase N-terminal domain-containing protein [Oscillospiraceae bacterium]
MTYTYKLTIDGTDMIVNGRAVKLDSPAVIRSDRTLVPVRAIAEAFGAGVDWNANGKLVIITE